MMVIAGDVSKIRHIVSLLTEETKISLLRMVVQGVWDGQLPGNGNISYKNMKQH